MKIIGIVGKSGSGKSTFALLLSQRLQCQHLDLDKLGHQAFEEKQIKDKLKNAFGNEIFDIQGNVIRKKLGAIVLGNKEKLNILTSITWPYIFEKIEEAIQSEEEYLILEAIKLTETKFWEKCDIKILVQAESLLRKKKVIERDNISPEYFDQRDASSINYDKYKFDYVYHCDYTMETAKKMIDEIFIKFKNNIV